MHKNIGLVINSLEGGGAERVFSTLVSLLDEKCKDKYNIEVITLDSTGVVYDLPNNVKHTSLNCNFSLVKSLLRLRKHLKSNKYNLVISFLTRSNVSAILGTIGTDTKVVVSERVYTKDHLGSTIKGIIFGKAVRFIYPHANRIVAVSEGVKRGLIEDYHIAGSTISVIPNSYDIEHIINKSKNTEPLPSFVKNSTNGYIVSAGRLVENKNFSLLIRAYSQLKTNKSLVILGIGPEEENLKALAKELGVDEKVYFAGFIKDPYSLIANAAIFTSASNAEGFPNAIVEAMALRVPIVSTNCNAGPAELLETIEAKNSDNIIIGKAGVLVPVSNESALKSAMDLVLNDKVLASELGIAAQNRSREFNHDRFIYNFDKVIQEVLK